MMNFFKHLFGTHSYLGVDIGTTSIKVVEIGEKAGTPRLQNYGVLETYGHLERLNDAIQTSSLKMMENETADLLHTLMRQMKFRAKEVVASLPSFSAFTTVIELPEMPAEDTAKAMHYQALNYVPLPISEVAIDWLKVGTRTDEDGITKQQVLLISVPHEHIKRYQNIFKAVGLRLVTLEVETVSSARILTYGDPTPTVIVDIGAHATNISMASSGVLRFSAQTDFAGASLTQALATGLNISVRRAEDLKKRRGLIGSGGEYELSTVMEPFLDAIINEVSRAIRIYGKEYSGTVERVMLSGGTANLLGMEKYIEHQLGLPVVKANPFARIDYPPSIEPIAPLLGPSLTVALGLGTREFRK